ncbi:MAG: putative quinol monooxygenase [Zhongshania sp.]|uniref:putative quinol monooxygenase n=1 Tax=Zhongshania sp. TaxID=1971902 RepID=UPI002614E0A9|nr:putative quinol monooxygenase [Zhongshania sp.]MDF1693279.1 putative quinol monooxygenase [Zhongshania sp.]
MAVQVILEFDAADGKADTVKAYFAEILPDTRRYSGFIQLDVLCDLDNPNSFAVYETWESREAYQNYFNWRAETGVFTKLAEMIADKPKMRFFENTGI